tara:strand:- start:449 stop:805 length:357 start_codon:yes stop_codon:yes gene_type:complete
MSTLGKYLEMERQLEELKQKMQRLEANPEMKREKEFLDRLNELLGEYGKTKGEAVQLLSPQPVDSEKTTTRRKRKLKIYQNPHTNEVVETRGGNHKTLKSWKNEYGQEEVESWVIEEK